MAKLPKTERKACRKPWADVADAWSRSFPVSRVDPGFPTDPFVK
jgi:hypothetical protein